MRFITRIQFTVHAYCTDYVLQEPKIGNNGNMYSVANNFKKIPESNKETGVEI